jgi:hypothetical protein
VVAKNLQNRAPALICQGVQHSVHDHQCNHVGTYPQGYFQP